jgi:hypothetical protein
MFTHRTRLETHPGASPVSSNSVLGRERKTMRSRLVASRAALHRDPPRIATLVASRLSSTQVTALRCDHRDSSLASRHFSQLSSLPAVQRIAGWRRFALRGAAARRLLGPQIPLPNGLGILLHGLPDRQRSVPVSQPVTAATDGMDPSPDAAPMCQREHGPEGQESGEESA